VTEQPVIDPEDAALAQTVPCPDCMAPADVPCRVQAGYPYHAARVDAAHLNAAERGTCALCSRPMVRMTRPDGTLDAFHPDPTDADACPQLPDPALNWNAYATAVNLGQSPGRPGIEHFIPAEEATDA
jgi:hypothetical protein